MGFIVDSVGNSMDRPSTILSLAKKALLLVLVLSPLAASAVDSVRIVGLFSGKAVVQLDGRQRLLRSGQTSPEGVRLVSANAREAVLEINGKRGTYTLGSHISSSYAAPEGRELSVHIWPDAKGMYTVLGSINGFPVRFLVDTGATTIAMNAAEARRLGIDYRVVGEPGLASTASGVVKSYSVVLDRVKVGDIQLRNVRAGVIDGSHPQVVLLGMAFLGRVEMARKGQLLELKTRQ